MVSITTSAECRLYNFPDSVLIDHIINNLCEVRMNRPLLAARVAVHQEDECEQNASSIRADRFGPDSAFSCILGEIDNLD